ncbi:GyrI-like domain-containing protein [Salibacterium halotolerans]|uniref:Predicted transcriptional regulator YdeE, contains AraC-type DNA-binding domain n=1 Tax=Salibacterium halotolerans TaxID=1884432 RepID=A0A1I5Y134_9BACI|nr:GyrI-like domain-containing protein [Salibacterium halotolerans]SFQ37895.1 Predicted transcriptional regulator YdeE, contains AraC-type DNA-binding domain [Salibacterium halotolerans]
MEYRFVEKAPFKVVGVMETAQTNERGVFIPNDNQSTKEEFRQSFEQLLNTRVNNMLHVAVNKTERSVDSYIGIETTAICPPSLVELEIPKQTWAVFEIASLSPHVINKTWYDLFMYWFPVHGYELANNIEFFHEMKECNRYELWIPVIKSKSY